MPLDIDDDIAWDEDSDNLTIKDFLRTDPSNLEISDYDDEGVFIYDEESGKSGYMSLRNIQSAMIRMIKMIGTCDDIPNIFEE